MFYAIEGDLYCHECAFLGVETEEQREDIENGGCLSDSSDSVSMCGHCARIWGDCDLTQEGFIPSLRSWLESLVRVEEPAWKCLPAWPKHELGTLLSETNLSHYVGKGFWDEKSTLRSWEYEIYDYLYDQAINCHDLREPEKEILYRIGEEILSEETDKARLESLVRALLSLLPKE